MHPRGGVVWRGIRRTLTSAPDWKEGKLHCYTLSQIQKLVESQFRERTLRLTNLTTWQNGLLNWIFCNSVSSTSLSIRLQGAFESPASSSSWQTCWKMAEGGLTGCLSMQSTRRSTYIVYSISLLNRRANLQRGSDDQKNEKSWKDKKYSLEKTSQWGNRGRENELNTSWDTMYA